MTISKLFYQRILILMLITNSLLTFGQSETGLLQTYISDFTSGTTFEKQLLSEKIMWSGLSSPSLFDLIEQDLIERSKNPNNKKELDNVAWLMKALGSSGQKKYTTTLQNLTSHNNSKIAKYAKEGLKLIPQHTIWNPIISDTSNANPDKSEVINRYANMIRSDVLELNILTPYPGTPLFQRLEKDGRLLTRDWSRYNQVDVVFKPKNMTEEELFEGARKVAKEYYKLTNVIARTAKIFSTTKNLMGFFPAGGNIVYRRYYKRDFIF